MPCRESGPVPGLGDDLERRDFDFSLGGALGQLGVAGKKRLALKGLDGLVVGRGGEVVVVGPATAFHAAIRNLPRHRRIAVQIWFEEPISPEDIEGYVQVSRALDMPVAGGENLFTRYAFRDVIAKKAMDIVQPDICCAGGFTECKKIIAMAHAHGVECVPHAWGSAIGLSATLQLIASIPHMPPCLVPMPLLLEFEQTENPLRDLLVKEPITQKNSIVQIPTKPGLGIEVDRTVLQRFQRR